MSFLSIFRKKKEFIDIKEDVAEQPSIKEVSEKSKITLTDREEELAFNFSMKYAGELKKLEDSFYEIHLKKDYKEDSIDERINKRKLALERLYSLKGFCNNRGKGGKLYFLSMWEQLHNSKNPCFSQEEQILEQIHELEIKKDVFQNVEKYLFSLKKGEEIKQTELYKIFPTCNKNHIRDAIDELERNEVVKKEKKGNSYVIEIL